METVLEKHVKPLQKYAVWDENGRRGAEYIEEDAESEVNEKVKIYGDDTNNDNI